MISARAMSAGVCWKPSRPLFHRNARRTTPTLVCFILAALWSAVTPTFAIDDSAKPSSAEDARMTVKGVVVSPRGEPVAGAKVQAAYVSREGDSSRRRIDVVGRATTNQSGRYTLTYDLAGLPDQRGRIDDGRLPQFLELLATSDRYGIGLPDRKLGLVVFHSGIEQRIVLAEPTSLTGRLVDLEGRPLAGVEIGVVSVMSARQSLEGWFERAAVNPRPVFSLNRMDRGNQQRRVHFPGMISSIKDSLL